MPDLFPTTEEAAQDPAGKPGIVDAALVGTQFAGVLDAAHKAVETLGDGPPACEGFEAVDEKIEAALHATEGAGELGQLTEREDAGEKARG